MISSVKLSLIDPNTNSVSQESVEVGKIITSSYNTSETVPLKGTLFMLVRRPGCPACREFSGELSLIAQELRQVHGIQIVAVVKENLVKDVSDFRTYFVPGAPVYMNSDLELYKYLTGGELVKHGLMSTLFHLSVWKGVSRAMKRGFKHGSLAGESAVYGGILLVNNEGQLKYVQNEKLGEIASVKDIMKAASDLSGVAVDSLQYSDLKRTVCSMETKQCQ